MELMRKDDKINPTQVQSFSVTFNSTLIRKAENSNLNNTLTSWKQKRIEDKLFKYLVHLTTLLDEVNPVDDKSVGEYYVENKAVSVENKTWELNADRIYEFKYDNWNIEDFINNSKKREIVGAEFGTGKTNFAKKIANNLSIKYLRGEGELVPIYVPLGRKLRNIYNQDSLEDVVKIIGKQKVFLICDGLDEYDDDHNDLIYGILPKKFTYDNLEKTIFTSRLIPDLPSKVNFNSPTYVRLLPFTRDQVNVFFSGSKYNIPEVTYDVLKEYGLEETEIFKPLFCWMFAITYNNSDSQLSIQKAPTINIKRALFFQEVIHSIIEGKHKASPEGKNKQELYMQEKKTLRSVAFLTSVYKNDLNTKIIADTLKISEDTILENPLFITYFNFLSTKAKEKKIEFFHKSFYEYLLAESFIEHFYMGEGGKICADVPNYETALFLEGLLEIIDKYDQTKVKNLPFTLPESLENSPTVNELKNKILDSAKKFFDEELADLPLYAQLPTIRYENMLIHRWMSLFVMNKIKNKFDIDRDKFFRLVKWTVNFIPSYLQRVENIDLSGSNISGEILGPNCYLCAKLQNSILTGHFSGTKFIGANLSGSNIEIGSEFQGVDFSGANMSDIKSGNNDDSLFSVEFLNCDFGETRFINAKLNNYNFKVCDFSDADFSDAELGSNFLTCDLRSVKSNEKTNAEGLFLCGMSFSDVHTQPHSPEKNQIIEITLNNIDSNLRRIIVRDNPNFPDS